MFRRLPTTLAAVAALLSCAGCIVTTSTYETKAREVEFLRDGYASLNREKTKLAAEVDALSKQVAAEKTAGDALAGRLREREDSLARVTGELDALRKACEGSRSTREQFIDELLGKEKATGKRLQELSSRADACEEELAEIRKKMEMREEPAAR